jgi:hypothetical protein
MILKANRDAKILPSITADLYFNSEANNIAKPFKCNSTINNDTRPLFYMTVVQIANKVGYLNLNNSDLNFQQKQIRNIPGSSLTTEDDAQPQ